MNAVDRNILEGSKELVRCPFPIPTGWFFIEYSDAIQPGEMKNVEMLDQEWVLFRTESGQVGVTDPFCPHLGAHIGHGGKVVGETVRCPFHHWQFGPDGWCKHIPYAKVMPQITQRQAILRALPTTERYGLIWVWHHPKGEPPSWDLPDVPEFEGEKDSHVTPHRWSSPINTAIQELAENGVDFPHLQFLHGYPQMPTAEWSFDGPNYHVNMMGGYNVGHQCGPGFATFRFQQQGVTATMLSYSQPITREKTMMRMSFTHRRYEEGTKEAMIAKKLVDHMVGEADGEESAGFESVDMIVWNNKKYRARPILCDGDGPILQYRAWFKQFYTGANDADI